MTMLIKVIRNGQVESEDIDGVIGVATDEDESGTAENTYILTTTTTIDKGDIVLYNNVRYDRLNRIASSSALLGMKRYTLREERS